LEAILKAIFFFPEDSGMESNSRERKEYKMVLQREREREMNISGLGNENIVVKREAGFIFKRW